jgi:geranylgeranyl diphosphate synthase type I
MMAYQLGNPGKGIRPLIVMDLYTGLGGEENDILPFAAAVELIHTASLIHDDIQDCDTFRRGRKSVWRKYSVAQAINFGDLLYSLAFELVFRTHSSVRIRNVLFRETARSVSLLVRGQMSEMDFVRPEDVSIEKYLTCAGNKTGGLFRLGILGAFLVSGCPEQMFRDDVDQLGCFLGTMFQIRDDLIDIDPTEKLRPGGSDLIRGFGSIVPLLAIEELDADERKKLIFLLRMHPEERKERIPEQIELCSRSGAETRARTIMKDIMNKLYSLKIMQTEPALRACIIPLVRILSGEDDE